MKLLFGISSQILVCACSAGIVFSAAAFSASVDASVAPPTSSSSLGTVWDHIPEGPPDAILGIAQAFRACGAQNKVNVCVGAYRDAKGRPWILPSVRRAEELMLDDPAENKEYQPIEGDEAYVGKALQFAYGTGAPLERIAGVQTLSGTGACRIGGQFLANFYSNSNIYVPDRKYAFPSSLVLSAVCVELSSYHE